MFWHCETITTINLINTSITYFCCDGKNIIYSFSQFQVSNTLLLITVTMMYITPPRTYSSCINETLYTLPNISSFLPFPSPWQPPFYCFHDFNLFRFLIRVKLCSICSSRAHTAYMSHAVSSMTQNDHSEPHTASLSGATEMRSDGRPFLKSSPRMSCPSPWWFPLSPVLLSVTSWLICFWRP